MARREEILEAARRVFARRSVFAASVTEIAQEADYSKAAIYFYFRNKEEIFLSLVLRGQDTYHDRLAERLAEREDRPAIENLRLVWDCLLDLAADQPDFFTLAAALPSAGFEGVAPPEIVAAVDRRGRDIFALIRRVIEWGQARGDLSSALAPGPTAPAIWAAFSGGILHAQTQQTFAGRALARDPLLGALFQMVACGLLIRERSRCP